MLCKKNIKYVAKIYTMAGTLVANANAENIPKRIAFK
jgi:hypothetical protein